MTESLPITWKRFEKEYLSENVEFKDKARDLLIKELGFEPDLRASIGMELLLRNQLKKLSDGTITQKTLGSNIELFGNATRSLIKDNIPEQYHFVKDHKDGSDILNGDD